MLFSSEHIDRIKRSVKSFFFNHSPYMILYIVQYYIILYIVQYYILLTKLLSVAVVVVFIFFFLLGRS